MTDLRFYNPKIIWRSLLMIGFVVLLTKPTNGLGFIGVVPFVLGAMNRNKPEKLFLWLMIMILSLVAGAWLIPKSTSFYIVQRCLLVWIACVSITQSAGQKRCAALMPFLGIFFYAAYMVIPSVVGWCPIVSCLKLVLFTITILAFYGMALRVATSSKLDPTAIRSVFLAVAIFFLIGSVCSIPFPAISVMRFDPLRDGPAPVSLFQGLANHSQCLGPLVSMISLTLFADLVFSIRRWDKLYLILLLCAPILIFKTSSRTAMGSFVIGIGILMFVFLKARGLLPQWRSKVVGAVSCIMILCLATAFAVPSVRDKAFRFIVKWNDSTVSNSQVTLSDITKSRQGLMDSAMENFRKSPMIGNGFQVLEYMKYIKYTEIKQLLSAPVEKGVWVTAILEEGGALGLFIFTIFSVFIFFTSIKRQAYTGATLYCVMIVSNFGEFTMFSMSYLGGFMWGCVFAGIAMDITRLRADQRSLMFLSRRI